MVKGCLGSEKGCLGHKGVKGVFGGERGVVDIMGCLGHKGVLWGRKGVFGGVKGCLGHKGLLAGEKGCLGVKGGVWG